MSIYCFICDGFDKLFRLFDILGRFPARTVMTERIATRMRQDVSSKRFNSRRETRLPSLTGNGCSLAARPELAVRSLSGRTTGRGHYIYYLVIS